MKKRIVKKYARELYEIMGMIDAVEKIGPYNNIWYDYVDVKGAKVVSGKRLRVLCRPEVIAYFSRHEGINLIIDADIRPACTYKLYSDHNYCCGSGDDVEVTVWRNY